MKKSFAIIGLGRFGLALVEALAKRNSNIIALDEDEEKVAKASELVSHTVVCDSTNEDALREAGIQNVDHVVVAIGSNIQATILTTIILKELGIKRITVRVDNEYYTKVILKLGANDIISPQTLAGIRLANRIISDTFLDYYDIADEFGVAQIIVNKEFKPITIQEFNPRNEFDVNVILIRRNSKTFAPKGQDQILPNDYLFVVGKPGKIARFDHFINEQ